MYQRLTSFKTETKTKIGSCIELSAVHSLLYGQQSSR